MPKTLATALCLVLITPAAALLGAPPVKAPSAADQKLAKQWLAERRWILNDPDRIRDIESLSGTRESGAEALKNELAAAKAGTLPPPFLKNRLLIGDIGRIQGLGFKVIQRLGASEARVAIGHIATENEAPKVIRTRKSLPEAEVFVRGFDLSSTAEGQRVDARGCFIVSKTATYTTAAGASRLLHVIEPFDTVAAENIVRQAVKQELDPATEERKAAEGNRKAAEIMARMMRRRHANALKYPALLSNARNLISAKLYDPAEKMLRQIVTEVPGTDAAEKAQQELDAIPRH